MVTKINKIIKHFNNWVTWCGLAHSRVTITSLKLIIFLYRVLKLTSQNLVNDFKSQVLFTLNVRAARKQSASIYKVLAQVVPLEMITYSNECINLTVRTTVWTMLERKIHPHLLTKWFWKQSEMGLFLWCQLGVWIFIWRLLIKTTICIWFRWYYNETGMLSVYLVRAPRKGHGSRWCVCWQAGCCVHLCVLVTR